MSKLFDRFLKDPSSVSCGCDDACCGQATVQKDSGQAEPKPAPLKPGDRSWIIGSKETPAGNIPVVATRLSASDRRGSWRVRWGMGRLSYTVPPGLYGVGKPDAWSPVFVSANYKMSFDHLRRALDGRDGWILVLDTAGINVWCAAGKGTFGTDELVRRIELTGLAGVAAHRMLVLPQLGAPGVAAHEVTKRTKFRVAYGPVRAEDLPAYLDAGMKATPEMRKARFAFRDRIVLVPEEIVNVVIHKFFLAILAVWVLGVAVLKISFFSLPAVIGAVLIGTVVVPALLPWIPGRPFALKGWWLGLLGTAAFIALRGVPGSAAEWVSTASYVLLLPAFSAFIAMGFTGSSPITSLSGVVKEMKTAVPLILVSSILGLAALITAAVLKA